MENIIKIIKEFEGIIGAILGSVVTLVVTDILKRKGKLNIYLMEFKGKYWYKDKDYGDTTTKRKGAVIDSYRFNFVIDVYKIIRSLAKDFFIKRFIISLFVRLCPIVCKLLLL